MHVNLKFTRAWKCTVYQSRSRAPSEKEHILIHSFALHCSTYTYDSAGGFSSSSFMLMYMYMYILDTHPDDKAPVLSLPQCVCAGGRVSVLDRPPGITVCEPPQCTYSIPSKRLCASCRAKF